MSGPKLSAAELERLRQEQLERERQEALRRLNEARKRHREACSRLRAYKASVLQQLQQISAAYRSEAEDDLRTLLNQLNEIPADNEKAPASYHSAADQMQQKLKAIAVQADALLQTGVHRTATDRKLMQTAADQLALGDLLQKADSLIDTVKLDFSAVTAKDRLIDALTIMQRHYKVVADSTDEPALVKKFAADAAALIHRLLDDCRTQQSVGSMQAKLQDILNQEYEVRRRICEFQAMYNNYLSLCALTDTVPSPPDQFQNSKLLAQAVFALLQKYKKQDEMDYIADQINIVMAQHGYKLIGSTVLHRKGNNGVSEMDYSLYQADAQSGISVFTDQSGAVMMRMTVLGDDPVITDADRDFSLDRQIAFCNAHMELVEALKERGVLLKQQSYQAPDRKHTWKMKTNPVQSSAQQNQSAKDTRQIDRRKRRRATKKKMQTL